MEQMLTGPVAGRFLELLVWFGRPQRVLEIGTFSGHSALSMAAALPDGGRIDTCELDPERAAFAQRYFDRSPLRLDESRCTSARRSRRSRASRVTFDFVFIDADKEGYVDYYEAVLPRLSRARPDRRPTTRSSSGRVLDGRAADRRVQRARRRRPARRCRCSSASATA